MTQNTSQVEKFHQNLTDLLDNVITVIEYLNQKGSASQIPVAIISAGKGYLLSKDKIETISKFIENSHTHWDKIHEKEDSYFVDNSGSIFGDYSEDSNFNALKVIFTGDALDKESKDIIRLCIFSLIKISIVYIF